MIKELLEILKRDKPALAPIRIWDAYKNLDKVKDDPKSEMIALVSLIRNVTGLDKKLTPYNNTVEINFRDWILKKNAGQHNRFTEEQISWLRMIRDYIAGNGSFEKEVLDLDPFNKAGGLGEMWELFGSDMDGLIEEMNEELAA